MGFLDEKSVSMVFLLYLSPNECGTIEDQGQGTEEGREEGNGQEWRLD